MRILHVISTISSVHGGPSRAMSLIEQALAAEGVEVETVTTDDDGPGRRLGYATGERREGPAGTIRWFFPKQTEFYMISRPLVRWVKENVRRFDVIQVHGMFSHTNMAAARRARAAGVPYVIRPLGLLNRYGIERHRPFLKRLSLRWVEGPILRDAAAVHFTDEAEQREAEELGVPMSGVIVPLGIQEGPGGDANRFFARHPEFKESKVVLFLSRIDPKKGLERLLEAVEELTRRDAGAFRLAIAGDGRPEYVASLKLMISKLGLANRVSWLGHVEGEEKADAFAAADAYVLPSQSENFGIALAEAMSCGLACVTTPGVAISRAISEAGAALVVEPEVGTLAGALERLLGDEGLRHELGANARDLVQRKYSLAAMGRRLRKLYESIREETGGRPSGGR